MLHAIECYAKFISNYPRQSFGLIGVFQNSIYYLSQVMGGRPSFSVTILSIINLQFSVHHKQVSDKIFFFLGKWSVKDTGLSWFQTTGVILGYGHYNCPLPQGRYRYFCKGLIENVSQWNTLLNRKFSLNSCSIVDSSWVPTDC